MSRILYVSGIVAAALVAAPAFAGDCTCKTVEKAGTGWCDHCKQGLIGGLTCKSAEFYKACVADKPKSTSDVKCKDCLKAMETNGTCAHCHVSFFGDKMFKSPYAYALAKGTKVDPATIKCSDCKHALEAKQDAFCKKCDAGLVHGLMYRTKAAFEKAETAFKLMTKAMETKCADCAAAIATDGECTRCRIKYKAGEKVKA